MKCLTIPALALMIFASAQGCSGGGSSVGTWQNSLNRYVGQNKNDPNVLRDVTINGNRPGFGVIGGDDPRKTTDAWGVLVGHQIVGERPWFVYLVGIVNHQKVQDIRLAAVSFAGGKPTWRMTKENKQALHTYQTHNRGLWQKQYPARAKNVPTNYLGFPRDADRFDLAMEGHQIDVTHTDSGAHWRLMLP